MKRAVITIAACVVAWQSPLAELTDFHVSYLSMEQGLTCNYVVDAVRDKNGFLWFATEEGLNRFDGSRFFSYYHRKGDAQSLSSSELNCILDDERLPILWIGTKNDGLNAFNYQTEEFTLFRHSDDNPESLSTNDITDIARGEDDCLWLTTYWRGVERFNIATGQFIHYSTAQVKGLPDDRMWCVADIGGGMVMAGHVRSGLSIIDTRRKTATNFRHSDSDAASLSGNEVCCIFKDREGVIWVGTDVGLDVYNPADRTFIHVATAEMGRTRVYDVKELTDGSICVATETRGLMIIEPSNRIMASKSKMACRFVSEKEDGTGLSGNSVRCIAEDSFENIWTGMYGGGVDMLTTTAPLFGQLTYGTRPNQLTEKSALSLTFDHDGQLWVGTDGDGLNLFTDKMERIGRYPDEVGRSVQTAYTDKRGNVWFGSFIHGAFVRCADGRIVSVFGREREDVRCFFERADGTMLVGSSRGIYVVDSRTFNVKEHIDCGNGLVRSIAADGDGRIWVAFYGDGIQVMTPSLKVLKTFKREGAEVDMPNNAVNHLHHDALHDMMWAATNEGAVSFDLRDEGDWRITIYDQRRGLENAHVRAITQDEDGALWMSTNHGISCLRTPDGDFINFNEKDNVILSNFNDGSVATDATGRIYFGSARGVCMFSPTDVLAERIAPPVLISALTIAGSMEAADSTINLSNKSALNLRHDQGTFTVEFNTQNFALNSFVEYSYRLDGLQDGWMTSSDGAITLRDLPPGDYRMFVRSRLHNQPWNGQVAEMGISILPPHYLSWWAKSIYVLLLIGLILLALKAYQRHLRLTYRLRAETLNHEKEQRLNEERLRFFTNITHELRTPVTLILGPLDDICHSADISTKLKHRLAVIYQSAVRLNELISQIMEFRKTETANRQLRVMQGNIVDAVHEICLKYEELSEKPDVGFRFVAPDRMVEMYYDREVIGIVVDNLVSNAIKYTDRGEIDISVERRRQGERHLVDITISDTGHGISAKALPHIFDPYYQEHGAHQASGTGIGLALVKSLVTLHEGEIKVESSQEEGTSFIITLDEKNVYPTALHGEEKGDVKRETEAQADVEEQAVGGQEERSGLPTLLIVEDNRDILDYVAESFADEYDVVKAENGRQGLAKALDVLPDVIISDIMMPEMDGNEMCRTLKGDLRTSHIPIILLTAKDSLEDKEVGYDAGADSYLTKPFTHSLLRSRINNLMAQRRRNFQTAKVAGADVMAEKREQLMQSLSAIDKEFFARLDELITQNIRGDVDVDMLASELAVSPSTLYRKMKALTGLSTNAYIRKVKMQYAEKLLLEGKYSISEVSFMVGMNSVAYFRRCFKEAYGDIPSEYLKRVRS